MSDIAPPVAALIEEFSKLPGVGVKTAQRLTFFILRSPTDLDAFGQLTHGMLNRIKAVYGEQAEIHVFPAIPVSAAVELGRRWMPKAEFFAKTPRSRACSANPRATFARWSNCWALKQRARCSC